MTRVPGWVGTGRLPQCTPPSGHRPTDRPPASARPGATRRACLARHGAREMYDGPICHVSHQCQTRVARQRTFCDMCQANLPRTNVRGSNAHTARNTVMKRGDLRSLHAAQVRTKRPGHSIVRNTNAQRAKANSNQKAIAIRITHGYKAMHANLAGT